MRQVVARLKAVRAVQGHRGGERSARIARSTQATASHAHDEANRVTIDPLLASVEGAIFFPGLPFLTINPMFPVARARAARALEGRGEGRTRASALPTDSLAPPAPRV